MTAKLATKQERDWAYELVRILINLGKSRKDIADGANISYSTVNRLYNQQVTPKEDVWKKLYHYGKQVDKEMHNERSVSETKPKPSYEKPIDQKFEIQNNELIWIN